MRALIWKEVREQVKWAMLWLIAIGLACGAALSAVSVRDWDNVSLLCSRLFYAVMLFGATLGGLLLGLLQTLPEARPGRWAFLMHRPLARPRIFGAKVCGGLLLFVPAMGLPLLGSAIWVATPGNVAAPFDARSVLPGIGAILTGIMFYFAGLLVGLRPARWWCSRGVPLVTAAAIAFVGVAVTEFWQAVLVNAVGIVLLAVCAAGCFLTNGEYRPLPRAAKLALGVTLFAGIGVVIAVVGTVSAESLDDEHYTFHQYQIDGAGRILRLTHVDQRLVSVVDPQGAEVEAYRDPRARAQLDSRLLRAVSLHAEPEQVPHYWSGARFVAPVMFPEDTAWYSVPAERLLYGYSLRTKRPLGTLGPDGFVPAEQGLARPFAARVQVAWGGAGVFLADRDTLYRIDFDTREIQPIYALPAPETVLACGVLRGPIARESPGIIVLTRAHLRLLGIDGTPQFTLAHPVELTTYGYVSAGMTNDATRCIVWYRPAQPAQELAGFTLPEIVLELGADGRELQRHELPALPPPSGTLSAWRGLGGAALPSGAVIGLYGWAYLRKACGDTQGAITLAELHREFGGPWNAFRVVSLSAFLASVVACPLIAWRISRRYAFTPRARRLWIMLALLGGPVMLLTLAALRDWPARVACPACARWRVVDRDACEHCGAPWPPPPTDGTEVFDTPESAA